jgi:methylase of polypeptide subunit release factors
VRIRKHRLAVEELQLNETTLPLADLSGIVNGDALRSPWPRADAIIANPPYHGSQNLRSVLGNERVEWLNDNFDCGVQDLAVYWFRRAAEQIGQEREQALSPPTP